MAIRRKTAGVVAAVVASVGLATAASAATAASGSGTPKPAPRAVKASAATAGTPVFGTAAQLAGGSTGSAYAYCPSGTAPTGGGGSTSAWDIFLTDSYASGSSWVVRGKNTGTGTESLTAFVLCQ
ncbi:hypothetical protein AB0G73_01620 [Streptomyces sp. NPDC020719]|uniref:hypothetical protein n=1 Tax=Streptomyces sp. NPDC020719 TaxID=3154896 RepID=UPI0033DC432C